MCDVSLAEKTRSRTTLFTNSRGQQDIQQKKSAPPAATQIRHIPTENFKPDAPSQFEAGMRVEHEKFGFGIIESMDGPAANKMATIKFEQAGIKKIMLNYAKLRSC